MPSDQSATISSKPSGLDGDFRRLFDATDDPVITVDVDGKVLDANAAAEAFLSSASSPLAGSPLDRWLVGDAPLAHLVEAADKRDEVAMAFSRDQGRARTVRMCPFFVGQGASRVLTLVFKKCRELGPKSLKMHGEASLGSLASEVGHELNNHLLVVSGYSQLLPIHLERSDWEKVDNDAQRIIAQVDRCQSLADGLIQFTPRDDSPRLTNVNEVLTHAHAFLSQLNRFDGIEFQLDLDPRIPEMSVRRSTVRQLVLTLLQASGEVLNKRDGAHRGVVRVSTHTNENRDVASLRIENPPMESERKQPHGRGRGFIDPAVAFRLAEIVDATLRITPANARLNEDALSIELTFAAERLVKATDGSGAKALPPVHSAPRSPA